MTQNRPPKKSQQAPNKHSKTTKKTSSRNKKPIIAHSNSPEVLQSKLQKSKRQIGFPIVGIGASAGGLEAFKQFFSTIPPDSGSYCQMLCMPQDQAASLVTFNPSLNSTPSMTSANSL